VATATRVEEVAQEVVRVAAVAQEAAGAQEITEEEAATTATKAEVASDKALGRGHGGGPPTRGLLALTKPKTQNIDRATCGPLFANKHNSYFKF
jgi:hypothetical protein